MNPKRSFIFHKKLYENTKEINNVITEIHKNVKKIYNLSK